MENFKKLSRDEMKKVLGGANPPACGGSCIAQSGPCKGHTGTCGLTGTSCLCGTAC
jgi:hypothetical protein